MEFLKHLQGKLRTLQHRMTAIKKLEVKFSETSSISIEERIKSSLNFNRDYLDLRNLDLQEIPEEIYQLKKLKYIDLSNNKLHTIPHKLLELPEIKELNLVKNPLESLPNRSNLLIDPLTFHRCFGKQDTEYIGGVAFGIDTTDEDMDYILTKSSNLRNLQKLFIGRGGGLVIGDIRPIPTPQLEQIIHSIDKFINLQSLWFRGIQLQDLPSGISQLNHLKSFTLRFHSNK